MASDHRKKWVFMGISSLVALGLAAAVLAVSGIDPEGIRRALRLTARFSFVLFWCAYAGGSLAALFGARFRALARRGRAFGLSFAVRAFDPSCWSSGCIGCRLNRRSRRKAPCSFRSVCCGCTCWHYSRSSDCQSARTRLWRELRLVGMEYIMLAFQADFLRHTLPADAKHLLLYAPFAALGAAGWCLRIVGWARKTQRESSCGISAQ